MAGVGKLFGETFADGVVIFREDEAGSEMFVIQEGEVEISSIVRGQRTVFCVLRKGDVFGEMALLDDKPRMATATARGQARIMKLSRQALLERVRDDPNTVMALLRNLSGRIRSLHDSIEELKARGAADAESIRAAIRAHPTT